MLKLHDQGVVNCGGFPYVRTLGTKLINHFNYIEIYSYKYELTEDGVVLGSLLYSGKYFPYAGIFLAEWTKAMQPEVVHCIKVVARAQALDNPWLEEFKVR